MTDKLNNEIDDALTPNEEANSSVLKKQEETTRNAPVFCWNCGQALESGQMFCPKCGSKADAPLERNINIEQFNENNVKKQKAKKKKLVLVVALLIAGLLITVPPCYVFYFEPNSRYNEAVSLYNDGEYEEAGEIFEEFGDFKDSKDRAIKCDTAVKQEKYDEAIKKAENLQYGEAIIMLSELGDFSDSKSKITEFENKYYELLQQIYAYVSLGFKVDVSLADAVHTVLEMSNLYDASDELAMSYLYSGSSYRTYYYWSKYSNGYAYVVSYDMAQAFVSLLDTSNDTMANTNLLLASAANAPQKYKSLYEKIKSMCYTYSTFHNFVNKEPSMYYYTYESTSKSYQTSVESAMKTVTNADSKIDDKAS